MCHIQNPKIIVAASKKEFNAGKKLFLEYSRIIQIDLSFQDFKSELKDISIQYNKPDGGLLLLKIDGKFTGCAGIRKIDPESAELKRMYIRKQYRGYGFGKQLLTAAIDLAGRIGYKKIQLDTLPEMKAAIRLYESAGFVETEPYRFNPIEGAKFFQLILQKTEEKNARSF